MVDNELRDQLNREKNRREAALADERERGAQTAADAEGRQGRSEATGSTLTLEQTPNGEVLRFEASRAPFVRSLVLWVIIAVAVVGGALKTPPFFAAMSLVVAAPILIMVLAIRIKRLATRRWGIIATPEGACAWFRDETAEARSVDPRDLVLVYVEGSVVFNGRWIGILGLRTRRGPKTCGYGRGFSKRDVDLAKAFAERHGIDTANVGWNLTISSR